MAPAPADRERNVLLKAPRDREREFDCCVDLLTPVEPANLNIWSLGISLPPDERLRAWEARREGYPADFRIVSGQQLPQAETIERSEELGFDPTPRFTSLDDPKNLTDLGVELLESLQAWEANENKTVVCFHSLTALLQHVSTEQAYQFLHPFTSKVREFEATAHYHLNPRAHDEREVEQLATLFDSVITPGDS